MYVTWDQLIQLVIMLCAAVTLVVVCVTNHRK